MTEAPRPESYSRALQRVNAEFIANQGALLHESTRNYRRPGLLTGFRGRLVALGIGIPAAFGVGGAVLAQGEASGLRVRGEGKCQPR